MRRVAVLGSTGSVGRQALEVVAACPDQLRVTSLAAHSSVDLVAEQAVRFGVKRVAMVEPEAAERLRDALPGCEVLAGAAALEELGSDPDADVVLNAIVGAAGLRATLAALDAGRTVALANKESCVAGGPLVSERLAAGKGRIVPVDSEHAATHMCLAGEEPSGVAGLVLTASGGPFRGRSRSELAGVSVADALAHPTWRMGAKITVDSATLMNKGLEVLEAHVLFGLELDRVRVICHPQSVIHCLVEFNDGSWKASMSPPDMRVPIAYALGHPDRPDWGAETVDWASIGPLTFEELDLETFGCVGLAYRAGREGGTSPAVLNAANEIAVDAFLNERLRFLHIADVVEATLDAGAGRPSAQGSVTLEDVLRADDWARRRAASEVAGRSL